MTHTITWDHDGCDEQDPIYAHSDPGVPHDDYGHPLTKLECNAVLFLESSDDIADDYLEADDDFRRDGPIEVEWNGEYYEWRHAAWVDAEEWAAAQDEFNRMAES